MVEEARRRRGGGVRCSCITPYRSVGAGAGAGRSGEESKLEREGLSRKVLVGRKNVEAKGGHDPP